MAVTLQILMWLGFTPSPAVWKIQMDGRQWNTDPPGLTHLIGCDTCQTSKRGPKHTILALIPFWWILTGGRILALENQSWCEKHGIGQFGTLSMKFYAVGDFCAASIWWPLPVLHLNELVHRLQLQPSYWLFEQIIFPQNKIVSYSLCTF